ncbi:hypothetical protein FPOAC1_012553 [Fusarium poae]|uniref:hypothetical protein n=1 Tax=Fusarium poae TaxID=36050 RepID=UPI001CEBB744|nr:hypothetical protein FPOAC1_012553 [Fusarium poae]KAG8667717.1 hypothetical protein FPOAC1_012553 [Fusarium poae]
MAAHSTHFSLPRDKHVKGQKTRESVSSVNHKGQIAREITLFPPIHEGISAAVRKTFVARETATNDHYGHIFWSSRTHHPFRLEQRRHHQSDTLHIRNVPIKHHDRLWHGSIAPKQREKTPNPITI